MGNFLPNPGFYLMGDISDIYSRWLAGIPRAENR